MLPWFEVDQFLQMESEIDKWVETVEPYNESANDEHNEELTEIQMYRVL
jgi:hypothetical protein